MSTLVASLATKRAAIIAITMLIAAAVGVTVLNDRGMFGRPASNGDVASALRKTVETGVNGVKAIGDSVASLFDSRSPGERAAGLLANMKQRRAPALHQRALPKVRGPVNPLAGIVGAVPTPPALISARQVPANRSSARANPPSPRHSTAKTAQEIRARCAMVASCPVAMVRLFDAPRTANPSQRPPKPSAG